MEYSTPKGEEQEQCRQDVAVHCKSYTIVPASQFLT
jgi:hypothetical protein